MRAALIAVLAIVVSAAALQADDETPKHRCSTAVDVFGCLLTDPGGFYQADYSTFFDALNSESALALRCDLPSHAARVLRLHSLFPGNAEVTQALQETTEKLLLTKPSCLLEATQSFGTAEASALAGALRHPLFSSAEEVSAAMQALRASDSSNPLVDSYFKR